MPGWQWSRIHSFDTRNTAPKGVKNLLKYLGIILSKKVNDVYKIVTGSR